MRVTECPHCNKQVTVTGDTGEQTTCSLCLEMFTIPAERRQVPQLGSDDEEVKLFSRLLDHPDLDRFVRTRIPSQPDVGEKVRQELQDPTTLEELRKEVMSGPKYWLPLVTLLAVIFGLTTFSIFLFDRRLEDAVQKHGIRGLPGRDGPTTGEVIDRLLEDQDFLARVRQGTIPPPVAQAPTPAPPEPTPAPQPPPTPTLPTCAACLAECVPVMKTEVPGISDEDANTACSDETCKAGSTCQ